MIQREEPRCSSTPTQTPHTTLALGFRQRRLIFREMIKAEVEAGVLRNSKRKRLLKFATKLEVPAFEANLLIAEVQHELKQLDPPKLLSKEEIEEQLAEARHAHARMGRILMATGASLLINVLMLNWLFR